MEPLKPEVKQRILAERPEAAPEDIEEYERLLSELFSTDPDLVPEPLRAVAAAEQDAREARLRELYQKLFGR